MSHDDETRLATSQRDTHIGFCEAMRAGAMTHRADFFPSLLNIWKPLYQSSRVPGDELADAWTNLQNNVEHRLEMAALYDECLADIEDVTIITEWRKSQQVWRYTLRTKTPRQATRLLFGLREQSFLASNHYWPLHPFFHSSDECPQAITFAERIVNLWVDRKVDKDTVQRTCETIIRIMEESRSAEAC